MEWWRKTRKPVWLIAALANAPNSDLDELLKGAATITPDDPAYQSVAYYSIQRELGRGHTDVARAMADGALSRSLLLSSRNLILEQRTRMVTSFDEFLKFGVRQPEPHLSEYKNLEEESSGVPTADHAETQFDWDAVQTFNKVLPLSFWVRASGSPLLPKNIQLQLAEAGWFRAVLSDDNAAGRKMMQRWMELKPERAELGKPFVSARNADELHYAAVFLVLHDDPPPASLSADQFSPDRFAVKDSTPDVALKTLPFVTAADRSQAASQAAMSAGGNWNATELCRESVAWARKVPTDPRVPEALHLAVRASHYRSGDSDTGKYSQQAFAILHSRYPKSPWTADTPYWYNGR
jgi:hypothetical protein